MPDNDVRTITIYKREEIHLTDVMINNHLALLADAFFVHLQIDRTEFGGIGLDCKRPFGNSYVEEDILEIIGLVSEGENEDDDCLNEYARELYHV